MKSRALTEFDIWSNVDYIGLTIIIIVGILVGIVLIWLFYRFAKSTSNVMNELAIKYNGVIIKGNAITGQQTGLTFQYNKMPITISSAYKSKGERSYTQVKAKFNLLKELNLHCYPKSILNYLNQWVNIVETWKLEKIEMGSSDFENFFTIKSNDGPLTHSLFTIYIQNNLMDLKKYNPNVLIDNNSIKIWCPFFLAEKKTILEF